jgi:hypothetical protein
MPPDPDLQHGNQVNPMYRQNKPHLLSAIYKNKYYRKLDQ